MSCLNLNSFSVGGNFGLNVPPFGRPKKCLWGNLPFANEQHITSFKWSFNFLIPALSC